MGITLYIISVSEVLGSLPRNTNLLNIKATGRERRSIAGGYGGGGRGGAMCCLVCCVGTIPRYGTPPMGIANWRQGPSNPPIG